MTKIVLFSLVLSLALFGNRIEKKFQKAGLVDIHTVDATIQVDLVNSDSAKNFFREDYYKGLQKAYLQKEVAQQLAKAQKELKRRYPGYSLCILDAARPRSVSQKMFDKMHGTPYEKFVANPQRGSMHNYGVAVDIVIVNAKGEFLDMGFTPFHKSHAEIEKLYAATNKGATLTSKQRKNRQLLSSVMLHVGFLPLSYEWWHFIGLKKETARKKYRIIE